MGERPVERAERRQPATGPAAPGPAPRGESTEAAVALAPRRARRAPETLSPAEVLSLQRTVGNAAVARLMGRQPTATPSTRASAPPSAPTPSRSPERGPAGAPSASALPVARRATFLLTTPPGPSAATTGPLPADLRRGIEQRSGFDFSDVRLHRDSAEPGRIGAAAFAQGADIYLSPGAERHLAHEAWHVVQQKQRRVRGTGALPDGRALNTDPALEGEAARLGAATAARAERPPALRAVPAPPDGPVQGVFRYLGEHRHNDQPHHVWQDLETNRFYNFLRNGKATAEGGSPAFIWVRRTDGFELALRPTGNPQEWEPIETPEERAVRLGMAPYEATERQPRPKLVPTDVDMVMVEDEPPSVAFQAPTVPSSTPVTPSSRKQAEKQLTDRGFRLARLETAFTVQCHLVPIQQGTPQRAPTHYAYPGFQPQYAALTDPGATGQVYTADQVGVAEVLVGNERPDTFLEPKKKGGKKQSNIPQGRHAVAWALLRRSVQAMQGRTAAHMLGTLTVGLEHIVELLGRDEYEDAYGEARALLSAVDYPASLQALRTNPLPIDRWQAVLSDLARLYMMVYHLQPGALFAGTSKQRGESDAVALFQQAEEALAQGRDPSTGVLKALPGAAADLLDAPFTLEPARYAFAVYHWIETLAATYPRVMAKHGEGIVKPWLDKPVTDRYRKLTAWTVATVGNLLSHFGHALPVYADLLPPTPTRGEMTAALFSFQDLQAHFVAAVELAPTSPGTLRTYTVTQGEGAQQVTQQLDLPAFTAAHLQVGRMQISDKDRPKTTGGKRQFSHTVAWTLLRSGLLGYQNRPLMDLLGFLWTAFQEMEAKDLIGSEEGNRLVQHSKGLMKEYSTTTFALHDWQHRVSVLVKHYVHAYQISRPASFVDDRTLGHALGHGEAAHMEALDRNEEALFNGGRLADDPTRVTEAATALFDGFAKSQQSEVNLAIAVTHWRQFIGDAFPTLWAAGKGDLDRALRAKNVGTALQPVRLGDVMDRQHVPAV